MNNSQLDSKSQLSNPLLLFSAPNVFALINDLPVEWTSKALYLFLIAWKLFYGTSPINAYAAVARKMHKRENC